MAVGGPMADTDAPACRLENPAPRVAPWVRGGVRSDDGWNTGFAHLLATTSPQDARGINWGCSCPACGASFRTTFGTAADAVFPEGT